MSTESKRSSQDDGGGVVPRPRTLLSRYLIGDDDDFDNHANVTKTPIDKEFEKQTRSELSCIQVISPRLDSMPSFGALDAMRSMSERVTTPTTTINEPQEQQSQPIKNIWSDDTIGTGSPKRSQYRISFEIIKARIVDGSAGDGNTSSKRPSSSSRYVNYTILVKRVPGLDSHPAVIERRYSDFYTFYNALKRRYPALLKDVPFPRKILLGNFSPSIISERCEAFKNFLAFCLSINEIRVSREFASFLYHPELKEAKQHLSQINLEEAGFIFENIYHLQEKLMTLVGTPSRQLIHTACCVIGCYNAIDNATEARLYAERTFEMLAGVDAQQSDNLWESAELVLPLILLSLRLSWFSGGRKAELENRAEELCHRHRLPRNFDSQPSLLEKLLKKDFQPLLEP